MEDGLFPGEKKEGQRVKEFLKSLRALPNIDNEEFKKRHGFSAFTLPKYNHNSSEGK